MIAILIHNVRSRSKDIDDIVSDDNRIMLITEKSIILSDSTWKIIKLVNLFKVKFNNNENIFLSLAYECRNDVDILN